MTPILSEISAAPHLPPALRPHSEANAVTQFMSALSGRAEMEVIEENDELFLVSHPVAAD